MPLKTRMLLLLLIITAAAKAQYVQTMGYTDYSFWGQVNIGNQGAKLTHPSAYLELGKPSGSTRGFLLPRGNKDSIGSPTYGLMIYNNPDSSVYFFNGLVWKNLSNGSASNNYPVSFNYASDVLTLYRNGMIPITVTLPFSSKLNVSDTANKWVSVVYTRGDSVFQKKGSVESLIMVSPTFSGLVSQYVRANGSYGTFNTDVQTFADTRYSLIGHGHAAADIFDLTSVVRNMFSGDSNINVNNSTGKITFTGTTGGAADGNNYANAVSWTDNVITIGRLGLSPLSAAWDSSKFHSKPFYDGIYQPIGSYQAPLSGTGLVKSTSGTISYVADNSTAWNTVTNKLNITDTANKWLSGIRRRSDTVEYKVGSTWQFAYKDSIGGGSGGTWGGITGSVNSQTDLRDSLRNRYISVRSINDTSWAYRKWNGISYTEDTLKIALYVGTIGDIISNGWRNLTIAPGAVTDTKLSTGINANKIADGSVSNTEFQYIDGLTSNAQTQINTKQATLVSGTNIKTVNGTSLLGSGNISISGGSGSVNDFRMLPFQVDSTANGPVAGASYFVLPSTMSTSKRIFFYREGELQHDTTGGVKNYQYRRHNDTIFVYPNLYSTERCLVQAYPDSNWHVDAFAPPATTQITDVAYTYWNPGVNTYSDLSTTAATNGGVVMRIDDQMHSPGTGTPNNWAFYQPGGSGNAPTYVASGINGKPSIETNYTGGSAKYLKTNTFTPTLTPTFEKWVVYEQKTSGGFQYITLGGQQMDIVNNSGTLGIYCGSSIVNTSYAITVGTPFIIRAVYHSASNVDVYVNGTLVGSGLNGGSNTFQSSIYMGSNDSLTPNAWYRQFFTVARELTTTEATDILNYLKADNGL